jgi:pimeloyl-ACP methyl ester carboxylesterase
MRRERHPLFALAIAVLAITRVLAQQAVPVPPGKLVDVRGIHLHIYCTGIQHGPSVILIAGRGDFSFDWSLVQSQVQASSRVCSYDRAGMAWSDNDPAEPNLSHVAQQLVDLLGAAQVKPPYILVGHSWGGAIARVAASLMPKEVAGIVLVDSSHEDQIMGINNTALRPRKASAAEWNKVWNSPAPGAPSGPPTGAMMIKAQSPSIEPPYTHLPKQAQTYRLWALSRPRPVDGGDPRNDLMTLFASREGKDHPLGDLPLIVITPLAVQYDAEPGFTAEEIRRDHLQLQAELATLSPRGKQVFAHKSGHPVQLDDPAVVIRAINEIVKEKTAS